MSTKSKHDKKINVINRTTSETLRLGETDPTLRPLPPTTSSLSIQSLPSVSRKKIQSSSSSFQITGVSLTRSDFGDDSADDLDESHTDDISRVTDNETPSFSEDSRDTDDHNELYTNGPSSAIMVTATELQQTQVKSKPPNEDTGARFKVVKIPSITPFSRGRWTCFDYLDNSEQNLNLGYSYSVRQPVIRPSTQASCVPTSSTYPPVNYVHPVRMENLFYERAYLSDLSTHYAIGEQINSQCVTKKSAEIGRNNVAQGSTYQEMAHSSSYLISRQQSSENQDIIKKTSESSDKAKDNISDVLSDINVALTSTGLPSNPESTPNNNNIDKKIEEALDAVKTHLMLAVHKEVDFLKTRVSTLEGRVNELEIENSILRVNYLLFKS